MTQRMDVTPGQDQPAAAVLPPLPAGVGVSFVMPVLNEASHLDQAVAAVLAQDYSGPRELVLALGESSDGTTAIAERIAAAEPSVRLVPNPDTDIPKGLNLAIGASVYPVVIRVDAHAELPLDYATKMIDLLRRTGAGNAGGVMVADGRTRFQRAVARAYNSPFGLGGGVYHHGDTERDADSAYLGVFRREALEAVGGFDETLRRGEDWELNHRIRAAGYRVVFTPAVHVKYWPRATPSALRRQMYATGVWRGHLVRLMGGTPLRYLPPPLVTVLVGLGIVLSVVQLFGGRGTGLRWVAAASQLGALGYFAGAMTVGAVRLGGERVGDRALSGLVLVIMHLSWGAGFLRGYLAGARTIVDRSRLS